MWRTREFFWVIWGYFGLCKMWKYYERFSRCYHCREMRSRDQDRVVKWGHARLPFPLFTDILNFHFLLFQFSPIFSLHENGWKLVYGNSILCLKAVKFAWWNNFQLCHVVGCADCQPTCFHSLFLSLFIVLEFLFLVCLVSLIRVVSFLFLFFYIFTRIYSYVSRMLSYVTRILPVCTRMYAYVIGVYPYVVVCYSYVLVWCFSHDHSKCTKHIHIPFSKKIFPSTSTNEIHSFIPLFLKRRANTLHPCGEKSNSIHLTCS